MTGESDPRVDAKERDEYTCQKCGHTQNDETEMKGHYVVPLDADGSESVDNVATLCPPCYRYAPDEFLEADAYEPVFEDYIETDVRPEADFAYFGVLATEKLASAYCSTTEGLENAELEEYLSDTIQQIFDYNPEEKDQLKTLICYDEAHRVLPKFGGTGRGVKMLERGAREFRKWGTGMLMISQVIEDFPEEVRANIGTQIQMRTEYEGDLDRIERKYGNNITQGVTKADTGTGMLQNSSYNHGRPYFVDFRPVKHSPERLSDEELDKFEKYNRRVDEIEDMIGILEDEDEDVFEYRSQLKLVKKNIRKRSFNLVDTYLDELEEDLNDELDI